MKKLEKIRIITMSSGDQYHGMESEFENISPGADFPFGAYRLKQPGVIINLTIPHIAIDSYLEPASRVKNHTKIKKKIIKNSKKK